MGVEHFCFVIIEGLDVDFRERRSEFLVFVHDINNIWNNRMNIKMQFQSHLFIFSFSWFYFFFRRASFSSFSFIFFCSKTLIICSDLISYFVRDSFFLLLDFDFFEIDDFTEHESSIAADAEYMFRFLLLVWWFFLWLRL